MKMIEEGALDPPSALNDRTSIRPEILGAMADVPLRRIAIATTELRPASVPASPSAGSAIALSRTVLTKIDFVAPEDTPSASTVARDVPGAVRRLCSEALGLAPPALEAAQAALAGLTRSVPPKAHRSIPAMVAANLTSDSEVHDVYFNIRRASKPEPAFYLLSLLKTLVAFREDVAETPVTIGVPPLARIETGLLSAISLALGEGPRTSSGVFRLGSSLAFPDHPARRWIRGHQIFAALTQGLIAAMAGLRKSGPAQRHAVRHIVIGLDASAAAFQFTGDLPEGVYDEQIRPSMCLPHTPRGFSGLLSADHLHLVRLMREMKPALEALRTADAEGHAAIAAALSEVYDSHKHVCSKFGGAERSSLLMVSDTGRTSVEQLDRFKTMRIRSLG